MNTKDKFKILIVEDMAITLLDLKRTVKKLGFNNIKTASNYHDAMSLFIEDSYELILMDINLGALNERLNGISLIKEFQSINHDFQNIYITAYSDEKTTSAALETNPVGFISKPFSEKKLEKLIGATLENKNKQ